MKPPKFWQQDNGLAKLLSPLGALYGRMVQKKIARPAEYTSKLKVICVGNAVMGGSGKTPVVQALAKLLEQHGQKPAILLRGYGGEKQGPYWMTPQTPFTEYGDEALLHQRIVPTIVSADRAIGARAIETNSGITHILMDDGLQNPSLSKDLSLLVVDGENPKGNGRLFPAGPLRETLDDALRRVQAIVLLGSDVTDLATRCQFLLPVFKAKLQPVNGAEFKGKPVIAFAGIGRPEKFFQSLRECDAVLFETYGFADHYPYKRQDVLPILEKAQKIGAVPVTTRKDWVRLPDDLKEQVKVLDVALAWQDEAAVTEFLRRKLTF